MTSIQEDNEQLVREFVKYLVKFNYEEVESRLHNDFQLSYYSVDNTGEQSKTMTTKDVWLTELSKAQKAISKSSIEIVNIISNDEEVWIWSNITGVHTGTFGDWIATNTKLEYQGVYRFAIKDGQIITLNPLLDSLARFIQFGAGVIQENDENKVKKYTEELKKMGLI